MQYHNFTLWKTVDIIISSLNFEDMKTFLRGF